MLRSLISGNRQNVAMVTFLRKYAGSSDKLPPTSVTEINRNVTLEQHSAPSDMPRPVVILLGWMFAKPAHLKKFSNIYIEQGFDVITVKIRLRQLLFPKSVQVLTRGLIDLCQKGDLRFQPLMAHGFSAGGYVYGELLVNLQKYPERYSSFRGRLRAQIFDSPVDFDSIPKGLSHSMTDDTKDRASIHKALEWYLSTFSNVILRDYIRSSEAARTNHLRLPSMFFYSLSDPVCDPERIEEVALSWRKQGMKANTMFWEKAPHVSTYKMYPDQYKQSLLEFIWRSGIKGHNPVRAIAEEEEVIPSYLKTNLDQIKCLLII